MKRSYMIKTIKVIKAIQAIRKKMLLGFLLLAPLVQAETIKIGMTFYDYSDPFTYSIRENIEEIAAGQQQFEFLFYNAQSSQHLQNYQIDALIEDKVQVLVVNLVDPAAGEPIIEKARAAKIPIVFFNKDPSRKVIRSYDKAYYIGADPVQSGIIQGDLIAKGWREHPEWDKNGDGKIQFALLLGEEGHPDTIARSQWVVNQLLQNNIDNEKLFQATADWNAEKGELATQKWLGMPESGRIEMIISNNDAMAIGAYRALQKAGLKLPIFGVDALPEALEMVRLNQLSGTVLNDGHSQALAIFQVIPNLSSGKEPDRYTGFEFNGRYLRIPYVAVDQNNLNQYLK